MPLLLQIVKVVKELRAKGGDTSLEVKDDTSGVGVGGVPSPIPSDYPGRHSVA